MRVRSAAVVALVVVTLFGLPSPNVCQNIAINPKRHELLKNVLWWLTIRNKGELVPKEELEKSQLPKLVERYSKSRAYRAVVIAFQKGVAPHLTLGQGQDCADAFDYLEKYRNPMNGSFSWKNVKDIAFERYRFRHSSIRRKEFCDYKKGLMCIKKSSNPTVATCECAPGATMQPISPGSSEKRCLVNEGEACAVADLDQGNGPEAYNVEILTEVVFNLEKPEGCVHGTQCRVAEGTYVIKCYRSGKWVLPLGQAGKGVGTDIGQDCSVASLTRDIQCIRAKASSDSGMIGKAPGYSCFNFGPPRGSPPGTASRIGFCAHDMGPWQIYQTWQIGGKGSTMLWLRNFVMGFVHRRSISVTSLDATALKKYYEKYLNTVATTLFSQNSNPDPLFKSENDNCNEDASKEMRRIWEYYAGLDKYPQTSDEKNLDTELENLEKLANDAKTNNKGICKPYWNYPQDSNNPHIYAEASPALECDKTGVVANGMDDGKCKVMQNTDPDEKEYAEKVQKLSFYGWDTEWDRELEEKHSDIQGILDENPEPECKPMEKQTTRSLPQSRRINALEDFSCPSGSICLPNYGDASIFDIDCNVKPNVQVKMECLEIPGNGNYEECEGKMLDKDIMKEMETIAVDKNALLGEGVTCNQELEKEIRAGVRSGKWTGNKRELLAKLIEGRVKGTGLFCDRSRLLECNDEKLCACVSGTNHREFVTMDSSGDFHYKSEYCYMTSGDCSAKGLQDFLKNLPVSQKEIELINNHYGAAEGDCTKGNHCMFVDQESKQCTERDTGKTGHDLKPGVGGGGGGGGDGGDGGGVGGFSPIESGSLGRRTPWKSIVGNLLTVILFVW